MSVFHPRVPRTKQRRQYDTIRLYSYDQKPLEPRFINLLRFIPAVKKPDIGVYIIGHVCTTV